MGGYLAADGRLAGESGAGDVDAALRVAAEAGRIVLESGGETYRAEDIIMAIAGALGALSVKALPPRPASWRPAKTTRAAAAPSSAAYARDR